MPINFFKSSVEDYFDTNIHNGDVAYKDFWDESENKEFPRILYPLVLFLWLVEYLISRLC